MKAMTEEAKKTAKESAKKRSSQGGGKKPNSSKKTAQSKKSGSSRQQMSGTFRLAMLGMLTAITIAMSFTPIGYIPIGPLKMTLLTIPVIVAATILSPVDAAIIGGVFGITSFIQAVSGMSVLTGALFQLNPVITFLLCVLPRVLEGLLGGLFFQLLRKFDNTNFFSYAVASISIPLLNTALFMTALYFEIKIITMSNPTGDGLTGDFAKTFASLANNASGNVILFFAAMVGVQALVEVIVCPIIGTAVSKALAVAAGKLRK